MYKQNLAESASEAMEGVALSPAILQLLLSLILLSNVLTISNAFSDHFATIISLSLLLLSKWRNLVLH